MESHHASLSVAGVASVLHRDNGSPFSLAVFGPGSIQILEESVAAAEGDDEPHDLARHSRRNRNPEAGLCGRLIRRQNYGSTIIELLRRRSLEGIFRTLEIVMQTLSHWIVVLTNAYMEYTTCNWNATHVYRRTVGYDQVTWC
ncbi:hypothetical protein GCT19_04730 [Paraburkholderia sp. CNPSo 3155]|uniref:hypothetical protein n=1 Tax=Paraburkholderia atlantica TaxID=2654982 RepID=UPI00128D27D7|nr:hypothetical protein [Paraburkholderia atlantica]MPW04957.1 hypothetical protein [Paraburkholderia atlantica]